MRQYKRLLSYLKPHLPQIMLATFCTILVAAATLLIAPLAGNAFKAIEEKNFYLLNITAAGIIGLYFIKGLFTYGQGYLSCYVSNKIIINLRQQLYRHLERLSLDFYSHWHSGEILSRMMNDITTLQMTILTGFTAIVPQTILLVGLMGYIFWLNWRLSLLTFIALPLIVQVIRMFATELRHVSERVQQKTADITSHVQETVSQIKTVQSFTMEEAEAAKFKKENDHSFDITMKGEQLLATQIPVIAFLQAIATVAIVWYGGMEIINGTLTLPQLISFATALGIMTDPGSTLSKSFTVFQQGMASAKRIFELLDAPISIVDKPGAKPLPKIAGQVELKNISFAYETEPVLENINLAVKPGEMIALVGRTGSGKSTLVNLLPRFFDPRSGQVLIDGIDLRDVTVESLRRQIAIVPQEIALFRGTIRENLAYGRPEASEAEIVAAAKAANAYNFIAELPNGLDSEVGERGAKLSGGEKQRIAIARAILRDPRILILDEATSSLDVETESLLREALEKLMAGRTSFVIAHRLYTVEKASRVVVLDNGRIVEVGTHQELLAKGGLYQYLNEIQAK